MKLKIVEKPVKHLVVEDFLSKEEMALCLEELKNLQDYFHDGYWFDEINGSHVNHNIKKCLNIDPYYYYMEKKNESYILREIIGKKLWSKELRDFYDSAGSDSIFSYMNETDFDQAVIAGFRDGDFYNWHRDLGVTTANIMLSNIEGFKGGDFVLSNRCGLGENERIIGDNFETITYEYKPGMAIIFPARFQHKVTKTETINDDIENIRFTLQSRCYVTNF